MSRSPGAALSRAAVIAARKVSPDELERAAKALECRVEREVYYARVVNVEDVVLNGWVYDLEVPEHHNFVAGGVLAHNTVSTGRALANRAVTTRRLRAMVVAEGGCSASGTTSLCSAPRAADCRRWHPIWRAGNR